MIIGIPKEIKAKEDRVGLTPDAVRTLVSLNHKVLVEKNAGLGSGFDDEEYKHAGAVVVDSAEDVYQNSEFIVKVKEPQPSEYKFLKKNLILFTYLHLAIQKSLTEELLKRKVTAIAYETIQDENKNLPLLIPMSEIAGRMSIQLAANLLENRNNGAGILLSGVAGVPSGNVLIVGAGHVGMNAAKIATGIGANVIIVDINIDKLRKADDLFGSRVKTYYSNEENLKKLSKDADVIIGAALIPGHKAPCLITEEMVKNMKKGSVIVDVSIDQGGIVETNDRIMTIDNPSFEKYGVVHYSVTNIPGSVPRTSSVALVNQTLPYIINIAKNGLISTIKNNAGFACGVNTYNGCLTNKGVAESLNLKYTELPSIIGF